MNQVYKLHRLPRFELNLKLIKTTMVSLKSIVVISVTLASAFAASVASISNCPALTARTTAAKDVTDLRIDDFKIVGALGDSIMAGFAMMGIDYEGSGILNLSLVSEYRGNSYAIGGDTGAVTLSNFIKRYQPNVQGASVLSHIVSFCQGDSCGFPETLCKYNRTWFPQCLTSEIRSSIKRQLKCWSEWGCSNEP